MKKLGFALGAGGSRGVAHIGFLQAMEENGIKPDFISGSSMGAVVGACYASGMTPEEMKNEVFQIKKSDVLDLAVTPMRNQALLKSKKMRSLLEKYLADKKFNDLKIPFCCVAVDLYTGKGVTLGGKRSVLDSVVASSSIPGIFKPVQTDDGYLLVDGGVKNRLPVKEVKKLGAEIVVAIDVLGNLRLEKDKKYSLMSVIFRTVDIYDDNGASYKLKRCKPDLLICPDMGDISQYKFNKYQESYDAGYSSGMQNAELIKKLINE